MTKATETHPYRKTQILTANPAELMLLLYNAAICFCEQGKSKVETQEFEEAHARLVRAENIVMELSSALRRDVHPDLVHNLSRLFEFVFYRLFEANVSHNPRCIDEALNVLTVLRDAWVEGILKANQKAAHASSSEEPGSLELSA